MIATAHVIIGGAVGVATQNPVAGLAAGIVSHLVCDTIPHLDHPPAPFDKNGDIVWTPAVWAFAFIDSGTAAILTLYFWVKFFDFPNVTPFVAGVVGGYLPDFIDNVPFWKGFIRSLPGFKQFHAFHDAIHALWRTRFPMPQWAWFGVLTQVAAVSICVLYLLKS